MECEEEEPLDPRVQIELDRLNASSEDINKLENKLEEANALFRSTLSDSTASLKLLSGRLGAGVEKARPYYEAREAARRTQLECQKAAVQFQRASVLHQNARETIQLAEERFLPRRTQREQFEFDNAWQEMLNHATMKLLEAEQLKISSECEHLRRANNFADAQKKLKRLERTLDRHIGRARPYFEQREVVQQELMRQKVAIQQLQRAVSSAKARYSSSLRELENISEQIHEQRRLRELEPDLVPIDLDTCDLVSVSGVTESATSDYEEDFKLSQEQQYWAEMREQIEAMSAALPAGGPAPAERASPPPLPPANEPPSPADEPPLAEELSVRPADRAPSHALRGRLGRAAAQSSRAPPLAGAARPGSGRRRRTGRWRGSGQRRTPGGLDRRADAARWGDYAGGRCGYGGTGRAYGRGWRVRGGRGWIDRRSAVGHVGTGGGPN
ncbi:SH3 domain-binding protein 5 homolog [Pollicipes pollicipes]|uniref:SH3 domain-binding protein 5 homolog n=1 Tax=Pollicipes pollicipes TaxID=41117 RepID=UPI001884C2D9|nr:SH3 domain-binding protein 5 homolog [Pollicipes pollicipes]